MDILHLLIWLVEKQSLTAQNSFFKSEIEVPTFKAEKHRTILVGRALIII